MPQIIRNFVGKILAPGRRPEPVELAISERYNTLGWSDYLASLSSGKVAGANVPTWSNYRDGINAYSFSASATNEVWITFHINHDYQDGSKVYPHVHWSPNTTSTGVVRWGVEYTVQKGHQQGAFPASTTIYLEDTISSDSQYQHRIIEASDAQAFDAYEADTLVLCRVFRDGGHANDTFPDAVFGLMADLHVQIDKLATPNKTAPFLA